MSNYPPLNHMCALNKRILLFCDNNDDQGELEVEAEGEGI